MTETVTERSPRERGTGGLRSRAGSPFHGHEGKPESDDLHQPISPGAGDLQFPVIGRMVR